MAVVQAVVESKDGEKFSDVGDANPQNCNSRVSKHLLRMASTRAKARALRDLTNIGLTALEELADLGEVTGDLEPRQQKARQEPKQPPTKPQAAPKRPAPAQPRKAAQKLSEAQHRAILNLAQRRKMNEHELEQLCQEIHGVKVDALTSADASSFIRRLHKPHKLESPKISRKELSMVDLAELRKEPHLSASSVAGYLECGLAYRFGKVDGLAAEFTPDVLIFGSTIHEVLAEYYRSLNQGVRLSGEHLKESFEKHWSERAAENGSIRYKEGTDYRSYMDQGRRCWPYSRPKCRWRTARSWPWKSPSA